MATTYEAIATVTVGSGGAANIEFTSIPGTYTDLLLKTSLRSTGASTTYASGYRFNGSTSGYTNRLLQGYGTNVYSYALTTITIGGGTYGQLTDEGVVGAGGTASTFTNDEMYIPNYAGSNNKCWSMDNVTEQNGTIATKNLIAGLWSNTSAITSILIIPASGNFAQYSTATLYGIKNS